MKSQEHAWVTEAINEAYAAIYVMEQMLDAPENGVYHDDFLKQSRFVVAKDLNRAIELINAKDEMESVMESVNG